MILGGLCGMLVSVTMSFVLPKPWATACGMIFFLVAIDLGFALGRSVDQGGYVDWATRITALILIAQ